MKKINSVFFNFFNYIKITWALKKRNVKCLRNVMLEADDAR